MNAPSVDIKDLLEDAGEGTFAADSGWGIYISQEPTSPDRTITLYDTGGMQPLYSEGEEHPTVQVRVRAESYPTVYGKIQAIKSHFVYNGARTINGTEYDFWLLSDVAFLRVDEMGRTILTMNLRMRRSD